MELWTPSQVGEWVAASLRQYGVDADNVGAAQAKIVEEEIDGAAILELSRQEVKDLLGIKLGHAINLVRMMKESQDLQQRPAEPHSSVRGPRANAIADAGAPASTLQDEQLLKRRKVAAPEAVPGDVQEKAGAESSTAEDASADAASPRASEVGQAQLSDALPENGASFIRSEAESSGPQKPQNGRPLATPQRCGMDRTTSSAGVRRANLSSMAVDFMDLSCRLQHAEPMLRSVEGKDAVLLVGDSGVGKTTFFLFMAGCQIQSGSPGQDYIMSEPPEALAGSRVSSESRSVTENIACWPLPGFEKSRVPRVDEVTGESYPKRSREAAQVVIQEVMLVDTPGFNDTRGETFDVTMSILVKRIAERCKTMRFVGFFDIKALSVRRGSVARDALSTLRKWVPDMESHLESFTFVFTQPNDALVRGMTVAQVPIVTEQLVETLSRVREGSTHELQRLWQWIEDDLRKEQPAFTKVFVPHIADRGELCSLILPAGDTNASELPRPAGIQNPRNVVRCGLSSSKEQALRVSLEAALDDLESVLCAGVWQKADVAEKMQALECVSKHVGHDMPFVDKVCQKVRGLIHSIAREIATEMIRQITAGTELDASGVIASCVPQVRVQGLIEAVQRDRVRLSSLAEFGCAGAVEDVDNHLHCQLQMIKDDLTARVQADQDPQGMVGLRSHWECLLAWSAVAGAAKDHYAAGKQEIHRLLSEQMLATTDSACSALQGLARVTILKQELLQSQCDEDLTSLQKVAESTLQNLVPKAAALMQHDLQLVNDCLGILEKPAAGQLVETHLFGAAMQSIIDAVQVVNKQDLQALFQDQCKQCSAVPSSFNLAMGAARDRIVAVLTSTQTLAEATLEVDLKIDVINGCRLHAALPPEMAADGCVSDGCKVFKDASVTVLKYGKHILNELQQIVMKCEVSCRLCEADAATAACHLTNCAALAWLEELDKAFATDMSAEVGVCRSALLEFFRAESTRVEQAVASLERSLGAKAAIEAAELQALGRGLRHLQLVHVFQGPSFSEMRKEVERAHAACPRLYQHFETPQLLATQVSSLSSFPAGAAEVLLELADLWPEPHKHLREHVSSLEQQVKLTFSSPGAYETKASITVALDGFQSFPLLASLLPSPGSLSAALHCEADGLCKEGMEACDADDVINWHEVLASCDAKLANMHSCFSSCIGWELLAAKAQSCRADLQRKAGLKRSAVEKDVKLAIEHLHFHRIRGYLQAPAEGNVVAKQVRESLSLRHQAALDCKHDAQAVVGLVEALQSVQQDVRDILLRHQHINIQQQIDSLVFAAQNHFQVLVTDFKAEVEKSSMFLTRLDYARLCKQRTAMLGYHGAVKAYLAKSTEDAVLLAQAVDARSNAVLTLIDAYADSVDLMVDGASADREQTQSLKAVLAQVRSRQQCEDEVQQAFAAWIRRFTERFAKLDVELRDAVTKRPGSSTAVLQCYKYLQETWLSWMQEHLGDLSPAIDLDAGLKAAQKAEAHYRAELRGQLQCKAEVERLLVELEGFMESSATKYDSLLKAVQMVIEDVLHVGEQCLTRADVSGAFKELDNVRLAIATFRKHLPDQQLNNRATRLSSQIRKEFLMACELLQKDISAGAASSKRVLRHFQALVEYVVHTWASVSSSKEAASQRDECSKACAALHTAVLQRVKKYEQELRECTESLRLDDLQKSIKQSREFAFLFVGAFAVYAQDVEQVQGSNSHLSLQTTKKLLQDTYTNGDMYWEIARSYARLELSPKDCKSEDIELRRKHLSDKHSASSTAQSKIATHRNAIVQHIGAAYDVLQRGSLGDDGFVHHITKVVHSTEVHKLFDRQLCDVKERLEQGMYGDVKATLQETAKWRQLETMVHPPLDVSELEKSIREAVESHAHAISIDALEHFENHCYKSLERCIQGVVGLKKAFGASHSEMGKSLAATADDLRERIMNRIFQLAGNARRSLKSPDEAQMHAFAQDLMNLGLVWCEISSFGSAAKQRITELLNFCLEDPEDIGLGPTYLCKLGRHLAKEPGAEGDAGIKPDGTMSHAAVSQRMVHEFRQFQVVQNMIWNEAVQKMQKDPEACIKEMKVKRLVGDGKVKLEVDDLSAALSNFTKVYEDLLSRFLKETLTMDEIIAQCLQKVSAVHHKQAQMSLPIEVAAKAEIPTILAYVFMHYTVASSGENFITLLRSSSSGASSQESVLEKGFRTPHNIQVLAVLRFFGFGDQQQQAEEQGSKRKKGTSKPALKKGLANQLVQVRTGEGKSLILGSASVVFALLGFRVRCVCYSAHLSNRDASAFERTFSDFKVAERIKYSQITTYSEDAVSAQGDIRSMTLDLLRDKPSKTPRPNKKKRPLAVTPPPTKVMAGQQSQGPAASSGDGAIRCGEHDVALQADSGREVLLIDEVDVLWGPDFYGKTYDPMARLHSSSARSILERLWQHRKEATDPAKCKKLLASIKSSAEYAALLKELKGFEYVASSQVDMMCNDLTVYMDGAEPPPMFDPTDGGRIGYKVLDSVEYNIVKRYQTAFAYLEYQAKLAQSQKEQKLNTVLALLVPCGQFSYANINPYYIFGVSGTVEQLESYQRSELRKHQLCNYTIMPSVYGKSGFIFLQEMHAIKICEGNDFHQNIALTIKEKITTQQRAIIVFFKDGQALQEFQRSTFARKLPAYSVLEEALPHEEKERLIKKAANTRQVTLATAIFGRGSDFACYDDRLQERGGLHVLQTFISLDISEEVQIKGRTARQGKKGTYSLILRDGDLTQELSLRADIAQNGQKECYAQLVNARRARQQQKFADIAEQLEKATQQDALTRSYFSQLLDGDAAAAAASFQQLYKQSARASVGRSSFHYILCLDESFSMSHMRKFDVAKAAALNFVKAAAELNAGTSSVVSLVMFSDTARIACRAVPLDRPDLFERAITCQSGGTEFGPPIRTALKIIAGSIDKYDTHCILMYTDGGADYPSGEVQMLKDEMGRHPEGISFFAIAEDEAQTLTRICGALYPPESAAQHCLKEVAPQEIAGKMVAVLQTMNIGYVKES